MSDFELSMLAIDRLAERREVLALAAAAFHADAQRSAHCMAVLASVASDSPDAFRWLWAMGQDSDRQRAAWAAFKQLEPGFHVPDDHHDAVAAFLCAPSDTNGQSREPAHLPTAQERLFDALAADDPFTLSTALRIVGSTESAESLRVRAAQVLAGSTSQTDRDAAVNAAGTLPSDQRVSILGFLRHPFATPDAQAVSQAVLELAGNPRRSAADAARLASLLDTESLAAVLADPKMVQAGGSERLATEGLAQIIGAVALQDVLEHQLPDSVIEAFVTASATQLRGGDAVGFHVWAHTRFEEPWTEPIREHLTNLVRNPNRPERRGVALADLRAIVLGSDSAEAATALASVLDVGELVGSSAQTDEDAFRRTGRLVGCVMDRDDFEAFEPEAEELLRRAVDCGKLASYTAGLVSTGAGTNLSTPERIAILDDIDAITVMDEVGLLDELVEGVTKFSSGQRAFDVLSVTWSKLDDNQIQALQTHVTWQTVSAPNYRVFIEILTGYSSNLAAAATVAFTSLGGPERDVVPDELLVHVLRALAAATYPDRIAVDVLDKVVPLLLQHSDDAVVDATAEWLRSLPPDDNLVRSVTAADENTGHTVPALGTLRRHLAAALLATSLDQSVDSATRVAALELADRADPVSARTAALEVAGSKTVELRRSAATILATRSGGIDDIEKLRAALVQERMADIKANLETALRRIESGSIGEALRNLMELADLSPVNCDPDVYVPAVERHEVFAVQVDLARATETTAVSPSEFVSAAILLADLLVDLAIVATADAEGGIGGLKPAEVELIRLSGRGRKDTGFLVTQQNLVQKFRWFSIVASLREKRNAHPTKIGTTLPLVLTAEDQVAARVDLRGIIAGWASSMETAHAASRPAP